MKKFENVWLLGALVILLLNVYVVKCDDNDNDDDNDDDNKNKRTPDSSSASIKQCKIFNDKYQYEYLYSPIGLHILRRNVFTWVSFSKDAQFTDQDKQSVWAFEPVESASPNRTYLIRNVKFDEYLYASQLHTSYINPRRRIFTWKLDADLDSSFHWQAKKIDTNMYELWNERFQEPLYAPNYFFKHDSFRRNVFTWGKKTPDSKQFHWLIKCNDQQSLF